MKTKRIGLLLGTEICWPGAYEAMMRRLDLKIPYKGETYDFSVRRVEMDPFNLTDPSKYDVCVDRLTHWYILAREWLKKAALVNQTYLLNNPFTFQAMEKHSAFCAMIRLGFHIPETWMLPQKSYPPEGTIYQKTAKRYNRLFDLDGIAEKIGYPLYMKPYNGGGWRGVSRIENATDLHENYDKSEDQIMHLQKAVEPFEVFVRSLSVGPQVLPMHYDASKPLHERYVIDHDFLAPELGKEVIRTSKTINAFFRWEYNSCEAMIQNGVMYPIDFANACPDSSLTSLHYYFPWVIKSMIRWTTFCAVTGRAMRIDMDTDNYFRIGDDASLSFKDKLAKYEGLADAYFETEKFNEFCDKHFAHLDEQLWDFFDSEEFDLILQEKVRDTFPEHEHDKFISHYRGLIAFWRQCNRPASKGQAKPAKAEKGAKATART